MEGDLNLDQWWDMRIMRCCDYTGNPSCGSVAEIESHLDLVSSWTLVTSSLCRLEKRPENLESFFKLVLVLKQSSMRAKSSLLVHLSKMLSAIASARRLSFL